MSKPRFKEHGRDRARRLALGKPHIYWSKHAGEWLATFPRRAAYDASADDFCVDQDERWTPRTAK